MRIIGTAEAPVKRLTRPFRVVGLNQTPVDRLLSSQTAPTIITDKDAVVSRYNNATTVHDYVLEPVLLGNTEAPLEWTSSDENVATVEDGFASHVAVGSAEIEAAVSAENRASTILEFSETGGETVDILQNYAAGSLAREIFDQVKNMATGVTASASTTDIYTSRDHTTPAYPRNANLWAGGLNLTGSAVYTETDQPALREATLLAPDIVHMVTHYEVSIGHKIRFVAADGTVVERTLISKRSTKQHTGSDYDITIGRLDSDVPASITPYKVLPANFEDYLGGVSTNKPLPCIDMVRSEKVGIGLVSALGAGLWTDIRKPISTIITDPLDEYTHWDTFWNNKVSGDSGNAAFLPILNEAVFLGGYTYSWAVNNPGGPILLPILNEIITYLGSPYQLTPADLSGFPLY